MTNKRDPSKPRVSGPLNRKDNPSEYIRIHQWIGQTLGKANHCDTADGTCSTSFQHANISQEYKWDISDWQQLCASHHKRYDITPEQLQGIKERIRVQRKHGIPIIQIDVERQLSYLHKNTASAARELKMLKTSINNCLMGQSLTAGGFRWQKRG